jgi:hypothetical protein
MGSLWGPLPDILSLYLKSLPSIKEAPNRTESSEMPFFLLTWYVT